MFAGIFSAIELILKLLKLWDGFLDWSDAKRKAEMEERQQKRDKAVDDSVNAQTEDEIWRSQDEITRNSP